MALSVTLVVLLVGALVWLTQVPRPDRRQAGGSATNPAGFSGTPIRIGLIPERDIFEQRKRYKALAAYLAEKLDRPVQLATLNAYEAVLSEFAEKKIDGAFLGSLVSVLAMDRLGAQVVAKPEMPDGTTTYCGIIFVREDSPIRKLEDIRGGSIGMVRTTTAGHLFPGCVLMRLNLLEGPDRSRITWVGTHDDVVDEVVSGRTDVGATKNLRMEAVLRLHPEWKIRRLAHGREVPNNALLLRKDVAESLKPGLLEALLKMDSDPVGRPVLKTFGAKRFVPCRAKEYMAVYDMADCILPAWKQIGVPGPAPRRPRDWPKFPYTEDSPCYVVNY
ncbi:MAG: phosphate/phosphite/phosphonate ABC transporter substrate-binding protein [Planctomycetota bacterium]